MGSGSQRGQRVRPAATAKRAGASQSPFARGNQQLQAPFVRALVLYPQGRAVPNRGGHVPAERDAHVDSPDGRHVRHRQRAGRAVQRGRQLPNYLRQYASGRHRHAVSAVRGAEKPFGGGGAVRRGAQAALAVSPEENRGRHVGNRRGAARYLHGVAGARSRRAAGAGAGSGAGRRGGGEHRAGHSTRGENPGG